MSFVADAIGLCAAGLCDPFTQDPIAFTLDPLHITVGGPLFGNLDIYAGGEILVTRDSLPIPEPSVAVLLALGPTVLAARRRASEFNSGLL